MVSRDLSLVLLRDFVSSQRSSALLMAVESMARAEMTVSDGEIYELDLCIL